MSKKWAKVESAGGSISGVGTLEIVGKKVKIVFEDDEKGVHTLPSSVLDDLTFTPKEGKDYYIALNGKGDALYNIRPANGIFTVRCVDFIRPDKEQIQEPAPITRTYKQTGQEDRIYHQFAAKLEIVDHKSYPGVTLTSYLPYDWFIEADDGSVGLKVPRKDSINFNHLEAFLELSGAMDTVLDWDDENILPALLTIIKKAKKKFDIELRDGYVNHYLPNRDLEEDDEDEVVEKVKAKLEDDDDEKPVRKGRAVVEEVEDED